MGYGPMPFSVYEYRSSAFGSAILCDGGTSYIEQLLTPEDFIIPFGGWIALTDDMTGRAYWVFGEDGMLNASGVCCENAGHMSHSSGRINPANDRFVGPRMRLRTTNSVSHENR